MVQRPLDSDVVPLGLSHLNLPAREPEALARWYESVFAFERRGAFLLGPRTLIAFEQGEPLGNRGNTHFGFEVRSEAELLIWANKLGAIPTVAGGYAGFKVEDPEGNVIEIYWEPNGPAPFGVPSSVTPAR